jgi:hypothetical protein
MASQLPRQDQPISEQGGKVSRPWYLYFAGQQSYAGPSVPFRGLQPNPLIGQLAVVNDSTTAAWGGTVAGGGANVVLAWFTGTQWHVIGA